MIRGKINAYLTITVIILNLKIYTNVLLDIKANKCITFIVFFFLSLSWIFKRKREIFFFFLIQVGPLGSALGRSQIGDRDWRVVG